MREIALHPSTASRRPFGFAQGAGGTPLRMLRSKGGGMPLRMLRWGQMRAEGSTFRPGLPVFLFLLTGLALLLRILRLDFQPLWWDEGYSVWFATHPLGQMVALTAEDIHPPLYYALVSLWTALLGRGPVAFRLFSVLAGTLAVPVMYLAGRVLLGRRGGLLAAFLLAVNPLHIYYSQEVRMYGLVALWSVGILAAAWRVLGGNGGRGFNRPAAYTAYILLTTLALYTQYYAVFLPIGLTLYALWRWRGDRPALLRWLAAQGAVALLYLPWVIYAAPRLVLYVSHKVVADADRPLGLIAYLARHLAAFIAGHLEGLLAAAWPFALLLLIPLGVGLALRSLRSGGFSRSRSYDAQGVGDRLKPPLRTDISPVACLLTVLLTALLLGWLIGLRYPFFPERGERLLLLALPAFVLLTAAAVESLLLRWRTAGIVTLGLVGAVAGASLWGFYNVPRYADDDYRSLVARTVEQGLPGDTVFCVYPWQVGYWRSYTADISGGDAPSAVLSPAAAWNDTVAARLDDALGRGRVWFPAHLALGGILETQVERHLTGRGLPFVNAWYGPGTRLSAWAADAGDTAELAPPAAGSPWARFALPGGGVLELAGVAAATLPVPAANAVTPLALTWGGDASRAGLAVSVRLTDDLGQLWAQHDYEPAAASGPFADRLGLLIPAGTPPGRYHVEASVRPKDESRPVDAFSADGTAVGAAVRLYDLDVLPADRWLGPERLPIATRRTVDLDDGLRFLGYSLDPGPVVPGETRKVSLFWWALGQPSADYTAFLQLLDVGGGLAANWEAPPGAGHATSAWAEGTLIRTQATFRASANLADGRYPLITGLFRTADGARLHTRDGADHIVLAEVTVQGRTHEMTAPQSQFPADVTFGSVARLVGYDLSAQQVAPGGSFDLILDWQALAATERPYTVFVHLLDAAGQARGYGDGEPGSGAFPTPGWLAGEYLADSHTVGVQADAPAGEYRLAVGFYDPGTGERLKLPDGADYLVLEQVVRVGDG